MARLWTFGCEEIGAVADLTKLLIDGYSGSISVVTTPVHGGTKALQFPSNSASKAVRSLQVSRSSGTLFFRMYAHFATFGTTPNTPGTVLRWVDDSGVAKVAVRFNPSTKIWSVENFGSGSSVVTNGTANTTATATWYRIELQVTIASTTSGAIILKVFSGENSTALETITLNVATNTSGGTNFSGVEFGNISGLDWGVLTGDDWGLNDDSGTTHASWCGPGKVLSVHPASNDTTAWTSSQPAQTVSAVAAPNLGSPNGASPNQLSATGGGTALPQWDNVNDANGGSVDDATYNYTSADTGVFDRFNTTPISPSDASAYSVIDVYARHGMGTGSGTLKLRLWDGATYAVSSPITPPTGSFRRSYQDEHLAYDIAGRSTTDVNQIDIGYLSDYGTGEKRVAVLWANVEYVPNGQSTVSSALVHRYEARQTISKDAQSRMLWSQAVSKDGLVRYESLGSATAVSRSLAIVYEILKKISREL